MDDTNSLRYSRHLLLSGWSHETQKRLMSAHAMVVGLGGLGAPATMYLASAGVGYLTLVDFDQVELSNLQRQIIHTTQGIGQNKAFSAQQALHDINPQVQVQAMNVRLDEPWLDRWLKQWQINHPNAALVVLDCTDQPMTRHAINRACWHAGVPLVSGAALQWDAQITAFNPRSRQSPCYACLYPPTQTLPDVSCATMGVFAPLVGMAGVMQAGEAIKLLAQLDEHSENNTIAIKHASLVGKLCMIDGRTWQTTMVAVPPRSHCPVCSDRTPQT